MVLTLRGPVSTELSLEASKQLLLTKCIVAVCLSWYMYTV